MASITRNHLYTVDLNKPLTRQSCGILLAEGDNNGDCFCFTLVRDGVNAAVDSTTVVSAYMIRQDGSTVPVVGKYEGNTVSVTLPKACYAQEGHFALAVKVDMSGATTTVAVLDGFIKNITTDTVVDPGAVIPTLEDLLAHIERMETATEAANTAAANAQEFIVTVTVPQYIIDGDMSGITSDKTYAEIRAAITAGKTPVVKLVTKGKAGTEILHLYSFAPVSINFRQDMRTPSTYNVSGSHQLTFVSTGSITLSSVSINSVPDSGTEGQVLVKNSDSTYGWKDSGELTAVTTLTEGIESLADAAGVPIVVWEQGNINSYGQILPDSYEKHTKFVRTAKPIPTSKNSYVNVNAGYRVRVCRYDADLNYVDRYVMEASGAIDFGTAAFIKLVCYLPSEADVTPEMVKENVNITYTEAPSFGLKLCAYGDSITRQPRWQNAVKDALFFQTVYNRGWSDSAVTLENKTLYINPDGTYAGNPITIDPPEGTTAVQCSFCHGDRVAYIPMDSDVVLVMGGTNDLLRNKPIGSITNDGAYDESTYVGALISTVKKIQARVPDATIVLMTPIAKPAEHGSTLPLVNSLGNTILDYAEAVRNAADHIGCNMIDVHRCGITLFNGGTMLRDGTHPNENGDVLIAKAVISGLRRIFSAFD